MKLEQYLYVLPLLPFLGAFLNGVVLRGRIGKKGVVAIACGSVGLAALLALGVIGSYAAHASQYAGTYGFDLHVYTWIPAGLIHTAATATPVTDLKIEMGFFLDALSCIMLFVVTFVGFWIHVYSVGYMAHEDGFQRFFTYLNLFMGAMLMLILGNNYLVMFVGWEGVGLCSYLLIGFYYKEEFPPYAGRKAFIVNRIGDFAFMVGLFALVANWGTLQFRGLFDQIAANPAHALAPYHLGMNVASFVALCLFVGAMGKSAQIPLYVWLPDAMAGPTPVSALIHAATMVTAGVYMVARSNVLYRLAPGVSLFVAIIGCATALFAGTIAIAQTDIKKVLAYSTVSQLGYMFLAAGVGAYSAAVFHLATHAFFKALLFLGSGSVIHAMGGEQDMRKMGGLKKHLPVTYWTFWLGTVAIAGIPPLAGFFSKDQILGAVAAHGQWALYIVGLLTAGLTATYMFRAVYLTFEGDFRGDPSHGGEQEHHLHESPKVMTVPLVVLAVGAVVAGWVGVPKLATFDVNFFAHLFDRVLRPVQGLEPGEHELKWAIEAALIALSVVIAAFGWLAIARPIYGKGGLAGGEAWARRFPGLNKLLANKYYVDEIYDATIIRGFWATARGLFRFDATVIDGFLVNGARHLTVAAATVSSLFDKFVVDGLVNLVGTILSGFSRLFRKVQTGYVSNYALVLAVGMFALVCLYFLLPRG
jgi:NADH-quinone oxidoreductase subunit L